jgi:hypothetical protein
MRDSVKYRSDHLSSVRQDREFSSIKQESVVDEVILHGLQPVMLDQKFVKGSKYLDTHGTHVPSARASARSSVSKSKKKSSNKKTNKSQKTTNQPPSISIKSD